MNLTARARIRRDHTARHKQRSLARLAAEGIKRYEQGARLTAMFQAIKDAGPGYAVDTITPAPRTATGGIVNADGVYLVGEGGPEIVTFKRKEN